MENKKKSVIILLLISILSAYPVNAATHIPDACSDVEVQSTWSSVFEETPIGITIFKNITVNSRCDAFMAFKINGNIIHQLKGKSDVYVVATKTNSTKTYINLLNSFTNISNFSLMETDFVQANVNPRAISIDPNATNDEFNAVFKDSPGTWTISILGDTTYSFTANLNNTNYLITRTGYLNANQSYISFNYNQTAICEEDWQCASWYACVNETQARTCNDSHNCGTTENKPIIIRSCGNCTSNWTCTNWSECAGNVQIRSCVDFNTCGTNTGKPVENRSCGVDCTPDWKCNDWTPEKCFEGDIQSRECVDDNDCGVINNKPAESRSCEEERSFEWIFIIIVILIILAIIAVILFFIMYLKSFNPLAPQKNPSTSFDKSIPGNSNPGMNTSSGKPFSSSKPL